MNEDTQPTETKTEGADSTDSSPSECSLSRYTKNADDGDGEWIGCPNNGGDVGDMLDTVEELNGLLIALHDAINSQKGVVPKSADRFYQANKRCHSY